MLKRILLFCLAVISTLLLWLTISNYRNSKPLADEMLFGIAHSIHAAIEFSLHQDPSLNALSMLHQHDVVCFALVDDKGIYRFHSNESLIDTQLADSAMLKKMSAESMTGNRIKLPSGEEAYEIFTHVQVKDGTLGLQLILHTTRADALIRSTHVNMIAMVVLLAFSWVLTALIYRYARREDSHKLELSRQNNLIRMGEMGAMLAHEIRNPLAGIKGFAQLIVKNPENPRTKDSAQRIVVETLRLEELTTDLLAFARNDEFPVTTIHVLDIIEQTLTMLRHEAEQLKVSIVTDCSRDLELRGNQDRLSQVIMNIISNGLQAMPDGGTLSIIARGAGADILIRVIDTGHGVNPEDLKEIFEPFFTTKARGTGLGLAICKKIIEEHKGTIEIESSNDGTKVTIVLPKAWLKEEA
jgi:two-component system sensor histidine kinase HydH